MISGRYSHHYDGYNENYSPYDGTPFQTVPSSVSESGWGSGDMAANAPHIPHPAFLHSASRDSVPPHSQHALSPNGDSKALLQPAMLAGYSGKYFYYKKTFTYFN